jgi:hypothetical protein
MSVSSKAVCLLPLLYFQTPRAFSEFDLGNNVLIRRISTAEIREIQDKRRSGDWPFDKFDIERIGYTLEKKIDPKKPRAFDRTAEQFLNLVLSMRLFKYGAVGYKAAIYLVEGYPYIIHDYNVEPRHPSIVPTLKTLKEKVPVFGLLTLDEKELVEYASFCKLVSKFGGREERWPLPIRYFSRMYEDMPYEDMLVSCMISFEGLVFKGEKGEREKKTALALSISMLVGQNSKEREKIKTTLKEAYEIRNDVVHGKHPRKPRLEIASLCWEAEDYLRRSIRKLLIGE